MDGITGLKQLGVRDLNYRMVFLANYVHISNNRFDLLNINEDQFETEVDESQKGQKDFHNVMKQFNEDELKMIDNMKNQPDIYKRIARCLVPQVYGHDEVKKGVLLMLFGGKRLILIARCK